MRRTITLEPDVAEIIQKRMREQGLSFPQAVNEAIRAGLAEGEPRAFETPTFRMGFSVCSRRQALALSGALEDESLVQKLAERN